MAVPGSQGHAAEVKVYDGNGDRLLATVTPFPGFEGNVSVAMGDVDGDNVHDLVVGAGKDHAPDVVAYSGKARTASRLSRRSSHASRRSIKHARGGVSVTSPQIDGTTADNIIVGSGPGSRARSRSISTELPARRARRPSCSRPSAPIYTIQSGVSVASGFVDFTTGRNSIVTAPGPGTHGAGEDLQFSLMTPLGSPRQAHSN